MDKVLIRVFVAWILFVVLAEALVKFQKGGKENGRNKS